MLLWLLWLVQLLDDKVRRQELQPAANTAEIRGAELGDADLVLADERPVACGGALASHGWHC